MNFPPAVEKSAFRIANGEYAWQRQDIAPAVQALRDANIAILGGELWLVEGARVMGLLPQHEGPPGVYHWESERNPDEGWQSFVMRSALDTLAAVNAMPREGEIPMPSDARIFYNLTWVTEEEFLSLTVAKGDMAKSVKFRGWGT